MIGLCSDNVLTILQPTSTIECLGDLPSDNNFFVPANGSVSLPMTPGKYILSINLTDLPTTITSLTIGVGSSKFPVFIQAVDSTTTVSVSCNYTSTSSLLISVIATPVVGTPVLSGSVFYIRVDWGWKTAANADRPSRSTTRCRHGPQIPSVPGAQYTIPVSQ